MTTKIISILDRAKNRMKQVEKASNEEDLKNKWLVPILQSHFHPRQDGVHYEKRVLNTRLDVRLMFDGRTRGAIELKSPDVALDIGASHFETYFKQAHKYARAFYVWRKGTLFPVQGILTNGHVAWIFDGGLDFGTAKATAKKINLNNDAGYKEFYEVIESMKNPKPHSGLQKVLTKLNPSTASADSDLANELSSWYVEIFKRVKKKEESLDLTLQMYLIAICRDCGFIPTSKIAQFESQTDWSGIVKELDKLFSYKFISIPKSEHAYLWKLYDRTRNVPVRLDTFPPDALGTVYEKLVRKIKGTDKTKTSFYTPVELVDEVLENVNLKRTDRILDPTAGSGAFLVACIQHLFPKETEFSIVKKYIEQNLVGIDIDPYACIIGKASILSAYATTLPYDPVDDLKIPDVKFHCHDFFDKKSLSYGNFDVVLGNPPWGSIDSEKILKDKEVKESLREYSVYKPQSDICVYVYERAFNLLRKNGRIGMVCKLQTTYGSQHENFKNWWTNRITKIFDYGDEKLFNNAAQTAVIIGSKSAKGQPKIIEKSKAQSIEFKGKTIGDYFHTCQGWKSGNIDIFMEYASLFPNAEINKLLLKNKTPCFFNVRRSESEKIAVIIDDDRASLHFKKWVDKKYPSFKSRKDCPSKYGWKRTYHSDEFLFDGTQVRLMVPQTCSSERIPCTIDQKGEYASITSQTILIPKQDTPKDIIYLVSAWISSTYFITHAKSRKRCKPMGNGGLSLLPVYIAKCGIPEWKNQPSIVKQVKKIMSSSSQPTEATLRKIDDLFLSALNGLGAKGVPTNTAGSIAKHQEIIAKGRRIASSGRKKSKTRKAG